MIKTIVCTGDSHTWGQGATGLVESLTPAVTAGDLRLAGFEYCCYVNLLRRMVCAKTKSTFSEYNSKQLGKMTGETNGNCAVITDKPLILTGCDLIRLEFKNQNTASRVSIIAGDEVREISLQCESNGSEYRTSVHFCRSTDTVCVQALEGVVLLYRAELYTGEYAVVNSGIGSCPTHKYMAQYWQDYVASLKPYCVVLQAHTINDWLSGKTPEQYGKDLYDMFTLTEQEGALPVALTVAPILGSGKVNGCAEQYEAYIQESRRAAGSAGVPLADANAVMERMIKGLDETQSRKWLFPDNWHVNDLGHAIYAQTAWLTILDNRIIEEAQK